jgi:hypothetical protein
VDLWFYRSEQRPRSIPRNKREPQARPASGQSDSASKGRNASGDEVNVSEPNMVAPGLGEGDTGLPRSKSVARAERQIVCQARCPELSGGRGLRTWRAGWKRAFLVFGP